MLPKRRTSVISTSDIVVLVSVCRKGCRFAFTCAYTEPQQLHRRSALTDPEGHNCLNSFPQATFKDRGASL